MVKARAYGLGLAHVVAPLREADGLAVLDLEEAAELRTLGWSRPILLLEGLFEPRDLSTAALLGLDVVVHGPDALDWILRALPDPTSRPARVWIKLNTGMNRLGFQPEHWAHGPLPGAIATLRAANMPLGFLTHLADAEHPNTIHEPLAFFADGLRQLGWRATEAISAANSAGCLLSQGLYPAISAALSKQGLASPCSEELWGRTGIALFGAGGFDGLLPATRLETEVISIQSVAPGGRVGYGGIWAASRPSRVAVIAMGYADGLPRCVPQGTLFYTAHGPAPLVGRVSMDMLTLDVTDLPSIGVGAKVQAWGDKASIDTLAEACGTIAYELLTAVTPRVPRVVLA